MDNLKKKGRYDRLYSQLEALLHKSDNPISHMATIVAVLHHKMEYFFWTGFYLLQDDKLQVGPYQGPVACQELEKNKGVCWASVQQKRTIVVPDVHQFPGHIACDSRSLSEIVIPIYNKEGAIWGVLDVDSKDLNVFDETDALGLNTIMELLKK